MAVTHDYSLDSGDALIKLRDVTPISAETLSTPKIPSPEEYDSRASQGPVDPSNSLILARSVLQSKRSRVCPERVKTAVRQQSMILHSRSRDQHVWTWLIDYFGSWTKCRRSNWYGLCSALLTRARSSLPARIKRYLSVTAA